MFNDIFKAYDIRATYPDKLNERNAWGVGHATGQFLKQQGGNQTDPMLNTVVVSRDMRPHSESLARSLIDGILASGMDVIDIGMCDTSFIYFAINHLGCAGGVQTTASHNPIEYNGFKISGQHAKPIGSTTGLQQIKQLAESFDQNKPPTTTKGKLEQRDLWKEYRNHILGFYKPGNRALKVFIDASNGMAGKMIPAVFEGVKNLEILPLNFETAGSFAHDPNPLVAENMKPTQDGVIANKADIGVCFDGDADRCMLTDETGAIIGCDHLTALFSEYFLNQSPKSTILYDLRSSKSVEETIQKLGGTPQKGRVGHVFMKALLRETKGIFGGELSGHFYFRDNFFADSGAIAFAIVATILTQSDKDLSQLIAPYKRYPQSGERNYKVEDKDAVIDALKEKFASGSHLDNLDGITIDAWDSVGGNGFDGWWFNVRPSNTEPMLRLNAEAKDKSILDKLMLQLQPILGEPVAGH